MSEGYKNVVYWGKTCGRPIRTGSTSWGLSSEVATKQLNSVEYVSSKYRKTCRFRCKTKFFSSNFLVQKYLGEVYRQIHLVCFGDLGCRGIWVWKAV